LFAAIRSARRPAAASSDASRVSKKSTSVSTPRARAASATFAAGSIPSAGIPRATKCWSR